MAIGQGLNVSDVYQSGDEWMFNVINGDNSYSTFKKDFGERGLFDSGKENLLPGNYVSNNNRSVSWNDFMNQYSGKSKNYIVTERDREVGINPNQINVQHAGPKLDFRYVKHPKSGKVIDMRHMVIVGSYGQIAGLGIEIGQLIGGQTGSAFQIQDFYSNKLGEQFNNFILTKALKHEGLERAKFMIWANGSGYIDLMDEFLNK